MTDRPDGLRTATVKGTAWSYVSFVSMRLPALITLVVLTRLIAPSDFGVIAIGLVVLTYLDTVNEFGINAAVIYSAHDDDRELSVAFWLSMASGIGAALVMSALAFPLATWFAEPQLRTVVPVLSLAFVMNSVGSVHVAVLKKRLQFRRLVPVDVARAVGKAGVAIGGAFAGWGVWSLVAGQLAGECAGSVVAWARLRWRPALDWDWSVVRRVLVYGSHIMGVGVTGVILTDLDYLIVGNRLGTEQLGFYSVGFRLPELAVMGVCYAVSATMFPVLTKLRGDGDAVATGLEKSLRVLALVTVPIGVGIALTSRDFVATFYGDEWRSTGQRDAAHRALLGGRVDHVRLWRRVQGDGTTRNPGCHGHGADPARDRRVVPSRVARNRVGRSHAARVDLREHDRPDDRGPPCARAPARDLRPVDALCDPCRRRDGDRRLRVSTRD